jgi:hypothetical protein
MDTSTPLIKPLSRIHQACGILNSKPTMWDGFYNSLMVKGTVYCCFLVQFPPYTDYTSIVRFFGVGNTLYTMHAAWMIRIVKSRHRNFWSEANENSGEKQMGRNFRQTMNVVKR